ncbi:hypothetical protein PQJ75_05675 [Rhodoplanes sp. TEM]|uniref:Molecular chaperone DnaJ n=1 Tax=Rhodoplanes tepidamans TaxID=200616 RepID=A0ABT5J3A0_RHOTP|nr:hypothetical protein [Rhodoplanes tepidamans]MDC7784118.1 hypothetical protein [Rhodoplanes tepidamans]MDC7983213.1 hypothetical protein [Rhodoplanes sp. TEM]MDQ0356785.1 RecJ-like exonuclease [Rhodoplanes tepidamans]
MTRSTTPTARPRPGDEAPAGTPGTGEAICPGCEGTGTLRGRTCPTCAGTGKVVQGIGGG